MDVCLYAKRIRNTNKQRLQQQQQRVTGFWELGASNLITIYSTLIVFRDVNNGFLVFVTWAQMHNKKYRQKQTSAALKAHI